MPWISKRIWEYTENELSHWRTEAQRQSARADRAVDRLLESVHSMPVSELGLGEAKSVAAEIDKKYLEQMRQIDEIHNDGLEDLAGSYTDILDGSK